MQHSIGNAFDSTRGFLYVFEGDRIKKFDRDGNFLMQWSCVGCAALGVDEATGQVFAARETTHKVAQFSSNGSLVREWGTVGSEPGQFRYPYDVAVDALTGNIYVTDTENARIQEFSPQAAFIRSFGTAGNNPGQFSARRAPKGLHFDPQTRFLYATDAGRRRILKFDEFGNFVLEWGSENTPMPGGIRWPRNVALDPAGNVHVVDTDNERIQVFDSQGQFVRAYQGPNNREQGPFHPRDIAIDLATGEAYVNASYAFRVDKFDASNQLLRSFGTRDSYAGAFLFPRAIAVSPVSGEVYVFDMMNFLLKRFTAGGGFLNQWGGSNRIDPLANGLFNFTSNAVAIASDGRVWTGIAVTHYQGDPAEMILQKFTSDGYFLQGFPRRDVFFETGYRGMAIDEKTGEIYLSDVINSRVEVFNRSGDLVRAIVEPVVPAGMTLCGGSLFVVDVGTQTVKALNPQGGMIREWSAPGGFIFNSYSGIACDKAASRLYVANTGQRRIEWYDLEGNLLGQFGTVGRGPGQLMNPLGVALDASSTLLYVLDVGNERVEAFCLADEIACRQKLDSDGDGGLDAADNCPYAANSDQVDADQDGAGDVCDCGPQDSGAWSAPTAARLLTFRADAATLDWLPPLDPAGVAELARYDTLRSSDAADFGAAAECIETNDGPNTTSPAGPGPEQAGAVFYYLVRPRSSCAGGGLGASSAGIPRTARACF